jgi:hypothetical protein
MVDMARRKPRQQSVQVDVLTDRLDVSGVLPSANGPRVLTDQWEIRPIHDDLLAADDYGNGGFVDIQHRVSKLLSAKRLSH